MTDEIKCEVRLPRPGEWIRVNPDPDYRSEETVVVDKGVYYLVTPEMRPQIRGNALRRRVLFLVENRQRELFVWPVKPPVPDNHIAFRAMKEWVQYRMTVRDLDES